MSSHWPTSVKLINCPREAAAEAVCVSQPAILITAKSVTCSQADKVHTGCFEALHNRLWSFAAASSSPPFPAPLEPPLLSHHQIALLIHLIYLSSPLVHLGHWWDGCLERIGEWRLGWSPTINTTTAITIKRPLPQTLKHWPFARHQFVERVNSMEAEKAEKGKGKEN